MLFGAGRKWWGDPGKRDRPHEGLDLCLYRLESGELRYFDAETVVPVIFKGQVVRVIDDFLGQSVFVSHGVFGKDGGRLHTVYGHLKPNPRVRPGERLMEGDAIGTIASAGKGSATVPPHLHVSVAWIPDSVGSSELDWRVIGDPARVALIDPLDVIECTYSIVTDVRPG